MIHDCEDLCPGEDHFCASCGAELRRVACGEWVHDYAVPRPWVHLLRHHRPVVVSLSQVWAMMEMTGGEEWKQPCA